MKVDDALDCCVPGLSVANMAVMSDVVCTGQDYNPGIFKSCCGKKERYFIIFFLMKKRTPE